MLSGYLLPHEYIPSWVIVQQTHGQQTLDNFCRLFYAGDKGSSNVRTYTEQDVLATLGE